jgi:hypothetical protein
MSSRVRAFALAILAALAIATPLAAQPIPPAGATATPRARSVLIITLPTTTWGDIRGAALPNLTRLFRTSAVADLATRSVRSRTDAGTGYLAFGAGTRAIGNGDAAATNMNPQERYAQSSAFAVFALRTGHRFGTGTIGALGWPALHAQNDSLSYGAVLGQLGQTLEDAKIGRRVIANADEQGPDAPVLHREAALTLVDTHGRVPGAVSDLLMKDPEAPFGQRLDPGAVMQQFPGDFRTHRQVVAVEASDLARADSYRPLASGAQRSVMHANALRETDQLVGRLVAQVDLRRDAVVVIAPYHSGRARTLTVAAIHAPGFEPGFLESATTRRAGFVQIVDIAPTVLDLVGLPRPDSMEGRAARVSVSDPSYPHRLDVLVRLDRAAQFRDATIGKTTATLVTSTIVLVVLAVLGFGYFRRAWFRVFLRWSSLAFLGYVAATFLVGSLPMFKWGTGTYFTIVAAIAITFAGLCLVLGRRSMVDPVLIALGSVVAIHLVDLVSGAHLELNTVFGYSPTVGIRLAGIGNPGSAELTASALLFAILLPNRAPRRGNAIGDALLLVTFVVVAAPMFGQDFGGALSLGPTIALWWLLRSGRRISIRAVLTLVGVLVGAGLVAGFVDLSRPANERTHVGRLFEKVGSDGIGSFFTVVGRKASLMFGTFSNTAWVLLVLSVLIGIWLASRRSDLLARVVDRVPTLRPGLMCFGLLVVLGTALNDSGVQVTGMMLATLLPVLVYLGTRAEDDQDQAADGALTTEVSAPTPVRSPA